MATLHKALDLGSNFWDTSDFVIGAGIIESIGAVLFLIPATARLGAIIIICFIFQSHIYFRLQQLGI